MDLGDEPILEIISLGVVAFDATYRNLGMDFLNGIIAQDAILRLRPLDLIYVSRLLLSPPSDVPRVCPSTRL